MTLIFFLVKQKAYISFKPDKTVNDGNSQERGRLSDSII